MNELKLYLESGQKKVFACAIDWPGWIRAGKDAETAINALLEYGPRYGKVLAHAGIGFEAPNTAEKFVIAERLQGDTSTDFGAPHVIPPQDHQAVDDAEYQRFEAILTACWQALYAAMKAAQGKELRKGPRGGGRELDGIVEHVLGGNGAYLSSLGWKGKPDPEASQQAQLKQNLKTVLEALQASLGGELPTHGPRGGQHWPGRYFVRRVAWHVLDHVWEIEDRIIQE